MHKMARQSDNYRGQGRSYERHLRRRRRMKQMRRIRRILVCAASLAIVLGTVWVLKGILPSEAEGAGVEVSRTLPGDAVLKQDGLGSKPSPQKNADVPYVKELLEMEEQDGPGESSSGLDFEEKLQKLQRLYEQRLITREEYEQKRAEILAEKW